MEVINLTLIGIVDFLAPVHLIQTNQKSINDEKNMEFYWWMKAEIFKKIHQMYKEFTDQDTWRWLLIWAILRPLTFINWRTSFGVAPAPIRHILHIKQSNLKPKKGRKKKRSWNCIKSKNLYLLSCPPSLSTAWAKQRWRSGVHLSLGFLDRTYGLTPDPLEFAAPFLSLSSIVLLLELDLFLIVLLVSLLSSSSSSISSPSSLSSISSPSSSSSLILLLGLVFEYSSPLWSLPFIFVLGQSLFRSREWSSTLCVWD